MLKVLIAITLILLILIGILRLRRLAKHRRDHKIKQQHLEELDHQNTQVLRQLSFQEIIMTDDYINSLNDRPSSASYSGNGGTFSGSGASEAWNDASTISDGGGASDGGGSSDGGGGDGGGGGGD
ncbi:MAG: hypothetical protein QM666_11210 [Acinetobacter sp.]